MLTKRQLTEFKVHGVDGEIGNITSLLFDDRYLTVRYAVVRTGRWFGTEVVLSPHGVSSIDAESNEVHFELTREQIKNAPSVDAYKPFSRQMEEALARHYGWPYWWASPMPLKAFLNGPPAEEDPHLRSSREILTYGVEGVDGAIGTLHDIAIDTGEWSIPFFILDTGQWLPGRRIALEPESIESIVWSDSKVVVNLSREEIRKRFPLELKN